MTAAYDDCGDDGSSQPLPIGGVPSGGDQLTDINMRASARMRTPMELTKVALSIVGVGDDAAMGRAAHHMRFGQRSAIQVLRGDASVRVCEDEVGRATRPCRG